MAEVLVTLNVRLESPEVDADAVQQAATKTIDSLGGKVGKSETKELAFGLKELFLHFFWPEEKGSADATEQQVGALSGVQSAQITSVTRALG